VFAVNSNDPTPIYAQLDRSIRAAIAQGRLAVGDRLPTVRQLAVDLKVNANTVAKVYAELERSGVLATQRGVGTFVLASPPTPTHPKAATARRERERQLRPLVDRLLADASAIGISLPEIMEYLQGLETSRTTKEKT
jgi:GntR family transcriptional regulator